MIALDNLRVTDPRELAAIVDAARISAPLQFPAILAGANGKIDVTFLRNRTQAPPGALSDLSRPHLVILGDDPPQGEGAAVGPGHWRCAARLQYFRPACCFIHASGGHQSEYAGLVAATIEHGRILVIETSSTHAESWARLMTRHCRTVSLLPSNGQHPIWEAVH